VFDLWADKWRKDSGRADVVVVRFCDDFVVGLPYLTARSPTELHLIYVDGEVIGSRGRYHRISRDGGETWSDPVEVDKPTEETGTSSTSDIKVSVFNQHVLLTWQRTDTGGNCSMHYLWSDDSGETWRNSQQMFEESSDCGQDNQLMQSEDGQILLWTILQDRVNLLAWDQSRWSEPQIQYELSTFQNPETLNLVAFDCRQPQLVDDDLAVVGCNLGGGGDIWFTSRELSDYSDWYSTPSDWSNPEELMSSQNGINSPNSFAT